jgi:hypothetical protein
MMIARFDIIRTSFNVGDAGQIHPQDINPGRELSPAPY